MPYRNPECVKCAARIVPLAGLALLAGLVIVDFAACAPVDAATEPTPQLAATSTATLTPTATPQPTAVETLPPTLTPTPTDLPTRTPEPTPIPTVAPTETPTPTAAGPTPNVPTIAPNGVPVSLVYGSNLRAGPGLVFDPFDFIEARREVLVLSRDATGRWLRVQAESGAKGWIAGTQFPATFDSMSVPLAEDIPQPPPTLTPTATPSPDDPVLFDLPLSGDVDCHAIVAQFPGGFPVAEVGQVHLAYNPDDPGDGPTPVYAFEGELPDAVALYVEGGVRARECDAAALTCAGVSFTLCASAGTGARVGDVVEPRLWLVVGTQSGADLTRDASARLSLVFTITDPG